MLRMWWQDVAGGKSRDDACEHTWQLVRAKTLNRASCHTTKAKLLGICGMYVNVTEGGWRDGTNMYMWDNS